MSLIYLDEYLPEIEVRELISGDDYMKGDSDVEEDTNDKKTGLNIYNDEEIYNQVFLLLQILSSTSAIPIRKKAKGFLKIHSKIINNTDFSIPTNIIPELSIQRKDNGDEDVFFDEYNEAHKIGKYNTRVDELRKAFLGYETTEEEPPQFKNNTRTAVFVKDTDYQQTVILPKDNLPATVSTLYVNKGISPFNQQFYSLNIVDKIASKQERNKTIATNPKISLQENVEKLIETSLQQTIQETTSIGSLYDTWKDFMSHGIDIETIDKSYMIQLIEKLQKIRELDKEVGLLLKPLTNPPKTHPIEPLENCSVYGFYTIQKSIYHKLLPILDTLKEQMLKLYTTFVDKEIEKPDLTLPFTAFDISLLVLEGKVSLPDVIKALKARVLAEQQQQLEMWYAKVAEWNVDDLEIVINKELELATKTLLSIKDEPNEAWKSVAEEIKHIKKGEVLSKEYDEATIFVADNDLVIENDDPYDAVLPIYEDDILPIDITTLAEGEKEIYIIVLRMFMTLQKASGLPLDYLLLTKNIPTTQVRKTKELQIRENFPELSAENHKTLNTLDMSNFESIIATILPATQIKQKFKEIYTKFLKDIEVLWTHLLAWWACDLQDKVLNHRLHFKIWEGSLTCIQIWTPYGAPMEGLKERKEGLLAYILSVINELVATEGTIWNKYIVLEEVKLVYSKLEKVFQTDLVEKVAELQKAFKTFEKDVPMKNILEKGELVKKTVNDTVEQKNKKKYLTDYMSFLKNLPSVLIQSSISKKLHLGCCLQTLNDKYKADYDWAVYVQNAYKLKKLFATQRISSEGRPFLVRSGNKKEEIIPSTIVAIKHTPPIFNDWNLKEWVINSGFDVYIPIADWTNPQKITEKTTEIFDILGRTITIDAVIKRFINETSTHNLIQCMRKLLQIQYLNIQTTYIEHITEYTYLKEEFSKLHKLNTTLLDNSNVVTEIQQLQHMRILQYFFIRQLCFPSKPELSLNKISLTLLEDGLDASLLGNFLRHSIACIKEWVIANQFNKSVNYSDYIAKAREEENISKLRVIDLMSPEERRLYIDAKKLGITELNDYINKFKEQLKDIGDDDYNEEHEDGDDDAPLHGRNDDENDEDALYDDDN